MKKYYVEDACYFVLKISVMCVFGWRRRRRLSKESASLMLMFIFMFVLATAAWEDSGVLGKILLEHILNFFLFMLFSGKFFVRTNEKFCPCLGCGSRECRLPFVEIEFFSWKIFTSMLIEYPWHFFLSFSYHLKIKIFRQKNFAPVWTAMPISWIFLLSSVQIFR